MGTLAGSRDLPTYSPSLLLQMGWVLFQPEHLLGHYSAFTCSPTRSGCVSLVEKYFPVCVVYKALEKHFRAPWAAKCCVGNRHYQTEAFPAAEGLFLRRTGTPGGLCCPGREIRMLLLVITGKGGETPVQVVRDMVG